MSRTNYIDNIPTREQQIKNLKNIEYDVLIVGGGVIGSGIALDSTTRGLKTALIERGDFGSETSSKSTKLIWGGIKYIGTAFSSLLSTNTFYHPINSFQNFNNEFSLVMDAHRERRFLIEKQSHLVRWVPIFIPVSNWIIRPYPFGEPLYSLSGLFMPGIFKFYDSLSRFQCPSSYFVTKKQTRELIPQIDYDKIKYGQIFYEGMHNDARTCLSIAMTAISEGATCTNYVNMISLNTNNTKDGVKQVRVQDNISGEEFDIKAKSVIFAGGAFTNNLTSHINKKIVDTAGGAHIVLPKKFLPNKLGYLDMNTSDQRFLFALPWQNHVLVGTTDIKSDPSSNPKATEEEIEWLLKEYSKYLNPEYTPKKEDILSSWKGYRPLIVNENPDMDHVSRSHLIEIDPKTKITYVAGGKWTTYRSTAEEVVDKVIKEYNFITKPCQTKNKYLIGNEGYSSDLSKEISEKYKISLDVAEHLTLTYGTNAEYILKNGNNNLLIEGFPYLESEVKYATKEYVRNIKDMVGLRTRLSYLNSSKAEQIIPRIADLMGRELKWSDREIKRQIDDAFEFQNYFI